MPGIIICGDSKYFHMIKENVRYVLRTYPNAQILIYDFGFNDAQRDECARLSDSITIIDWLDRARHAIEHGDTFPPSEQIEMALAFNSRSPRGLKRRIRKHCLKHWPNSLIARKAKKMALRFETLVTEKVACIRHASEIIADQPMYFLDADAIVLEPVEECFGDGADVVLTMIAPEFHNWRKNQCSAVKVGVAFFSGNVIARNAFLDVWLTEARKTYECWREQTAMNRYLRKTAPEILDAFTSTSLTMNDVQVSIRTVPTLRYNCFEIEFTDIKDLEPACIYHFKANLQEPQLFQKVLSDVLASHNAKKVAAA